MKCSPVADIQVTIVSIMKGETYLDEAEKMINFMKSKGKLSWTMHPLGLPTFVFSHDTRALQHVLKDNFENYGKGPDIHVRFKGLLGNGIFNVDGKQWYHHRKTSAHLFNTNKFKGIVLETCEHKVGSIPCDGLTQPQLMNTP